MPEMILWSECPYFDSYVHAELHALFLTCPILSVCPWYRVLYRAYGRSKVIGKPIF